MSYSPDVREWIARRAQKDEELYQRHGTALELKHTGKFAAISDDGRIFLGNHELDVAMQAVKEFGSGNFALRRIGYKENIRLPAVVIALGDEYLIGLETINHFKVTFDHGRHVMVEP